MLVGESATLQIHPTLRCNLRCKHCYSASGPDITKELPIELLTNAISQAADMGYTKLAVSGGEPFLYRRLPDLLCAARDCGMLNLVTTNALLVGGRAFNPSIPYIDFLAVSLDGQPSSHNQIRCSTTAFQRMQRNLPRLEEISVPFGFIFTLTRFNAHEIEWVAAFSHERGARALQIHPLTESGRASVSMVGNAPDGLELLAALSEGARLSSLYPDLQIHVDAVDRAQLLGFREWFVPRVDDEISLLVPTLIVDAEGTVRPLTYDIAPRFHFGSLRNQDMETLRADWDVRVRDRFWELIDLTHRDLTRDESLLATYWYNEVAARSLQIGTTKTTRENVVIRGREEA